MNKVKRLVVRRSPKEWRTIISRFECSGLTCRQFCSAEKVALSSFAFWRRKLSEASVNGAVVDAGPFVELVDDRARSWDAELDFGDGLVLRLRRGHSC